jgi:hypothetical protein
LYPSDPLFPLTTNPHLHNLSNLNSINKIFGFSIACNFELTKRQLCCWKDEKYVLLMLEINERCIVEKKQERDDVMGEIREHGWG